MNGSSLIRIWLLVAVTVSSAFETTAQRQMEPLGRGVSVIRSATSQAYIGWRLLSSDPRDAGFNVFRSANGGVLVKLNALPITNTTDFLDTTANFAVSNAWFVQPIFAGVTQALSAPRGLAASSAVRQYVPIPLQPVIGGANPPYDVKFCWVGDLDGDGEYDYVVDRISTTANVNQYLQAYKRNGTFLWQINMGPNSTTTSGNSTIVYEPSSSAISTGDKDNVTVYDMDGDGRAEVLVRTANGVVFGNGTTLTAGANDSVQFMSVIDGLTGAEITRAAVPNPFIADGPLNSNAGILYGDGVHPYVFLSGENRVGSGAFQRIVTAWSYQNGQLTQRWSRPVPNGVNESRGHQVRMADVNHDGIDELIQIGSAFNGANGQPIYDTEIVHGDRYHVSDLDPDRPGLETYVIQQNNATLLATALIDAASGVLFKKWYAGGIVDVGRGEAWDMDPRYRGVEVFSTQPGIFDCKGNQIPGATAPWPYSGLWWDADNQREILGAADGNGFNPVINKWNATANSSARLYSVYNEDVHTAFGGRPAMFGDLFGDWREEFVVVADDYSEIRIYTTKIAATNRLYCLMQNPAYRIQCTAKGYYQCSYTDYYLGEQMQPPAPPQTSDARLVWRGGANHTWDAVTANWMTNNLWVSNFTAVPYLDGDSVLFDLTGSNSQPISLATILLPGEVTVHSPNDFTFAGPGSLSGPMLLTKAGRGSLTLSGTNDFTGPTTVWEGALVVDGVLSNSPVTVRGGTWLDGALAGRGFVGSGATIHRGGSVSPGAGTNVPGTLTVSNHLTLVDGAVLRLDLSDDFTSTSKTNDLLVVLGDVNLTGTNFVEITTLDSILAPGTYPLVQYSGALSGTFGSLRLRGLDGVPVSLTNLPGQIALVVKSTRPPAVITWTGGLSANAWDLAASSNWLNGVTKDYFVSRDTVRFDNTGSSNLAVNLSGALIASNVIVDSTANYVFSGGGSIIGSGSVLKSNTGTLTLNGANNTYTGRTIVGGGTLVVSELDAVGYPSPLGNPPGGSTNLVLSGNSTLRITGESYTDRGLTIGSGTNSIEVSNAADQVTIAGQIAGTGALQKTGSGVLALTVANTHSGGTIIKSGTVSLGSVAGNQNGVGPGGVTLDGGRLSMIDIQASENAAWAIRVPAGSSGRLDCDGRCTLSGPLTGGGDFTIFVPYVRTDFSGNWSAFTGRLLVISDGGDFRCNNSAGYPNARMNLGANVSLQNRVSGTPNISIGELSGDAASNISAPGGNGGIGVNWSVGGLNTSATFAGNTYNNVGLIKVGTGTWTLSGATISHTGQTTVNGGTLLINGNAATATGAVGVGANGTLGGTGIIRGTATISGKLAPGSNGIGTLTFSNNVTLTGSSTTFLEINRSSGIHDLLKVGGTLNFGGALVVSNVGGAFAAGDSFQLFNAGVISGSFSSLTLPPLPPQLLWNTSQLNNGVIAVMNNPSALGPQLLTWKGDGAANLWDAGISANWLATNNASAVFNAGDTVNFTDVGSNQSPVVLSGILSPASVVVSANKDYVFAGNGSLAGTNDLVKSGTGMLTLLTSNSYSGQTIIDAGTLRIGTGNTGLKNRWSFNGNLVDSAGGQAAVLVEGGANNATLTATNVTLAGGARASSDYVSLGANLLPNTTSPVTIELWATQNAIQNWARIFDFGASMAENLFMSWTRGTTLANDRVEWKDAFTTTVDDSNQPFTVATEFHLAMVIEPGAGANGTTRVTWYRAGSGSLQLGSPRGTFDTTNTLAAFNDSSCWLGRSQYTGDNTASASYNEVRIWTRALSAAELQTLHLAGPDAGMIGTLPIAAEVALNGASAVLENASGGMLSLSALTGVSGSELRLTSGGASAGANDSSSTFVGSIAGTGAFTKVGSGTVTLSGSSGLSGATIVSNGSLVVIGAISNSPVSVWNGTISGGGWLGSTLNLAAGTTLVAGNPLGTFSVSNAVALSPAGTLRVNLDRGLQTNSMLRTSAALDLAGQLEVVQLDAASFASGDRFQILEAPAFSGAFTSITLPTLAGDLNWRLDQLPIDGSIWVLGATPPLVGNVSVAGSELRLAGIGGVPGWEYYILATTNLSSPVIWSRIATNQFDASGNFSLTNSLLPGMLQQFFRLQVK